MQFDRLESLCTLLDLSKREVINMALNEFFVKADAIVAEVDPFENAHDAVEEK
jgi:nucleoside 2-deoxyribosyltransferase